MSGIIPEARLDSIKTFPNTFYPGPSPLGVWGRLSFIIYLTVNLCPELFLGPVPMMNYFRRGVARREQFIKLPRKRKFTPHLFMPRSNVLNLFFYAVYLSENNEFIPIFTTGISFARYAAIYILKINILISVFLIMLRPTCSVASEIFICTHIHGVVDGSGRQKSNKSLFVLGSPLRVDHTVSWVKKLLNDEEFNRSIIITPQGLAIAISKDSQSHFQLMKKNSSKQKNSIFF